eukprot:TRINITY_DN6563_c0_g1_i1.p1 TRINITY_DN6563_c0_g1~~TRINITY_DN6563_c0_g1_i1.p1  ORF type:complete len:603 (+),score=91.58 TRINITY_DN6563_c0_g1_i1:91-1899(+)
MDGGDEQKGFYVDPKRDCPHIVTNINTTLYNDTQRITQLVGNGRCEDCDHVQENWLCLACGLRFCSRYVHGHMQEHASTHTNHNICASYSDLSLWCFACESYITDPMFRPLLNMMANEKFGSRSEDKKGGGAASGGGLDIGTGGRYTAHATATQMEELEDPPEEFNKSIKALAQMIRESKHFIAFTGAGVSTSAGVPDFRGPQGVWTLRALNATRTEPTTSMLRAVPTPSHMSLVALQDADLLKFVVSQNIDGMHRRSGIAPTRLAELHGNSNLEVCTTCGKEYLRDFDTSDGSAARTHATGRQCSVSGCNGGLVDTIIHFEESLPREVILRGFAEAEAADLCLCLGSSLTVTPAATIPKTVGKNPKAKLVIVNLQRTPLDSFATLRIHAKIDKVMEAVMEELGIPIAPFVLKRRLQVSHQGNEISVGGVDVDGTPVSLLSRIVATFPATGRTVNLRCNDVHTTFQIQRESTAEDSVDLELHFMGHYGEDALQLSYPLPASSPSGSRVHMLSFNLQHGKWGWRYADSLSTSTTATQQQGHQQWPATCQDEKHEHELKLTAHVYGGAFRCDHCLRPGLSCAYHCAQCSYDLHPYCTSAKPASN